jgi:hypothetical protein
MSCISKIWRLATFVVQHFQLVFSNESHYEEACARISFHSVHYNGMRIWKYTTLIRCIVKSWALGSITTHWDLWWCYSPPAYRGALLYNHCFTKSAIDFSCSVGLLANRKRGINYQNAETASNWAETWILKVKSSTRILKKRRCIYGTNQNRCKNQTRPLVFCVLANKQQRPWGLCLLIIVQMLCKQVSIYSYLQPIRTSDTSVVVGFTVKRNRSVNRLRSSRPRFISRQGTHIRTFLSATTSAFASVFLTVPSYVIETTVGTGMT